MHLIQTKYVNANQDILWFEYLDYSFDGWIEENVDLDKYRGSYSIGTHDNYTNIPVRRP
ncbi:hypothetical protein pVco7_gp005 [Vibrio phage pVco-7]|uniref:Uncharacterized protein n=1 Tax=Vibrio phage pVco-5 TaxID=1965485 RepID=A0A1W6JUN3_9CAUD|nr:hypothetical protein KNT61_gp006 [Vibrio phage pVco-5]ARM70994.1 hypothetical protein pVco5_006 [Vibrio phage pVco-5]